MSSRPRQAAYSESPAEAGSLPLQEEIRSAMYRYQRVDLGLSESLAHDRAVAEIGGELASAFCDEFEGSGLSFLGKRVLDLGAGLGGLSLEIARRGGVLLGIEPGEGWRRVAARRLQGFANGTILGAVGEQLPFADNSIDLILSRQVLEHVQDPRQVIAEAYRVLRPGGYILMTYENYFSFFEPPYHVLWLPLLPKRIGAAYLRARNRDPRFLLESITYTTFAAVRRHFFAAGFECMRTNVRRQRLRSPQRSLKWRILRSIAKRSEPAALWILAAVDYSRRMLQTAAEEFMRKPSAAD